MIAPSVAAASGPVVLVDSRSPSQWPLSALVECAARGRGVRSVRSTAQALDLIAAARPSAVLAHAELEAGASRAMGPILAALVAHEYPDLPFALYTGKPDLHHEVALAKHGVRAPVVRDERLVLSFDDLLTQLLEHANSLALMRTLPAARPCEADERIPDSFRIEQFLGDVEDALTRASADEHDCRTAAAAALRMPVESFHKHRRERVRQQSDSPRTGPGRTLERGIACLPGGLRCL